jgi:hypothetical protein
MAEEQLDPQEEVKTTPVEGSEPEALDEDLESLFADDNDSQEDPVKKLETKINSIEKGLRKYFSKKGIEAKQAKEEPKVEAMPTGGDKYAEKLLKLENPNSQYVLDELNKISKESGLGILDAWDKFSWIRKEADARAEEADAKEKTEKKISKPTSKISGRKGEDVELSDSDRALLSRRPGLMEKYQKEYNK